MYTGKEEEEEEEEGRGGGGINWELQSSLRVNIHM